jgi:hypothetical protein
MGPYNLRMSYICDIPSAWVLETKPKIKIDMRKKCRMMAYSHEKTIQFLGHPLLLDEILAMALSHKMVSTNTREY